MKTEAIRLFTWIAYLSEVFKLSDYTTIRVKQFGLNKGVFKLLTLSNGFLIFVFFQCSKKFGNLFNATHFMKFVCMAWDQDRCQSEKQCYYKKCCSCGISNPI